MRAKHIKITLLSVLAVLCSVFAFLLPVLTAKADGVVLEGDGNEFLLSETSYGADEKFVFTATANFENGNAAGIVFGANEDAKWVFNIDRNENRVKLMYFSEGSDKVLLNDWFIGNDKMTEGEKSKVNPKVAQIDKVQLKVIISPENDKVHAEFYADNIQRFAFDGEGKDVVTDLNALQDGLTYKGGSIGYNCFHAKVVFNDIYSGVSDYSYYTELYRQQYHFSQYAHWNNDPNGLVYYDGWYHLYYQTHPFSNYWSDMYWGHARSRDLVHWQHLPICLFPDVDFDGRGGDGYMWSGSAMVYHAGDSAAVDALNWYPNGGGTGLIAFYTRDGAMQDQVIMSSDDGGLTWTKRKLIPQTVATAPDNMNGKTDCRDPKVFPVKKDTYGKTTLWGMALTGMQSFNIWFLQSEDLLNWTYAGGFKAEGVKAECPDVVTLAADDNTEHNVLTLTGRGYIVGEITYDDSARKIKFCDLNGNDLSGLDTIPVQTMDFGPDSFATQSYYIDDKASEFYGKTVSVSWFSGVPGAPASIESGLLADARKVWNGGGMTVPVEWGLKKTGDGYVLTQTPIVKSAEGFRAIKTQAYTGTSLTLTTESENILANVNGHCLEIDAEIINPDNSAVYFRINMNSKEYTEIGWNVEDGYYVDRTHTADAGLSMNNYRVKYKSGACGEGRQTFYILSDNGGVEVFCGDFTIPFYVLTFASPYAQKASFVAEGNVTVSKIKVNNIGNVWRTEDAQEGETVLYVESENVELDKTLTASKEITVYSTSGGEIEWAVESGEDVVSVERTEYGAKLTALSAGSATVSVSCGNAVKNINVTVYDGTVESDLSFNSDGIVSGNWFVMQDGLLGVQSAGDGFILSENSADNFTYSASFSLSGAAAAIVFRAKADMSDYLIANYDNNGKIVKLWSPRGELGRASVENVDVSDIILKVKAKDNNIVVYINGAEVINITLFDTEPKEGHFGLNSCAARTTFKSILLLTESYTYSGGNLNIKGETGQAVTALYNRTAGNVKINPAFYTVNGRTIEISQSYFQTLKSAGTYSFTAVGAKTSFDFSVTVSEAPLTQLTDISVDVGCNAVIYTGNITVSSVTLNGVALTDGYSVKDGMLTISSEKLSAGNNTVIINGGTSVTVSVTQAATAANSENNTALVISLSVVGGVLVLGGAAAVTTVLLLRRKKKNGGNH